MRIPEQPDTLADLLLHNAPQSDWFAGEHNTPTDKKGRYLHWDDLRFKEIPANFSRKEYWIILKLARMATRMSVPLTDKNADLFSYTDPVPVKKLLHELDSAARGNIGIPEPITNQDTRRQYVARSLIEEAFSSSFLEGAVTTRQAAREIIRKGRKPESTGERMVLNNYKAIQFINENRDENLTPEIICEIHRLITQDTLDRPEMAGCYRGPADNINVFDDETGEVVHMPPPADELKDRVRLLCDFANDTSSDSGFIHPLIRAIILHFMLAYDHPFVDGNGRTARALFYWSALRSGYWILEYTSISRVLVRGPAKYARSFLFTETDEGDLTYFLIHQLEVIHSAMDDLKTYLTRKSDELRTFTKALEAADFRSSLNHRQIQLLEDAVGHPGAVYTINEHATYHGVSYLTGRQDLLKLYDRGFFRKLKEGKRTIYIAEQKLIDRISKESG